MQATLDKAVKFSQPSGDAPATKAANVEKVVCDTTGVDGAAPVSVVDSLHEHGQLVRYQRIESRELSVVKSEGRLDAPGPGEVRILQMGPKNNPNPAPPGPGPKLPAPPGPPPQELKLTYVRYSGNLRAFNERRLANFSNNVEVLHLPADSPRLQDNFNHLIDHLPPGALYLKSEYLEVLTQQQPGGKSNHVMRAKGRAHVEFDEYIGDADVIKYDEAKQHVIFEGSRDLPAVVNRRLRVGGKPQSLRGEKFTYDRVTGRFDGAGVTWIEN
jgi:hypothetical protein